MESERPDGHAFRDRRSRRHGLAAPPTPAQRMDRTDAQRVPVGARAPRRAARRSRRRRDRHPTGVLRRRRQRGTRRPRRRGSYDSGVGDGVRPTGLRRPTRVRPGLRLPVRDAVPDHRRGQRRGRRRRPGAGAVLRPSLRRRAGQVHHGGTQAGPARRVRHELDAAAPGRRHPRHRPAAVGSGLHAGRDRRVGPVERRRPTTARRAGIGARVRERSGHDRRTERRAR